MMILKIVVLSMNQKDFNKCRYSFNSELNNLKYQRLTFL